MCRKWTWQITKQDLDTKKTGMDLLQDEERNVPEYRTEEDRAEICRTFESIRTRVRQIATTWISHIEKGELTGSSNIPPHPEIWISWLALSAKTQCSAEGTGQQWWHTQVDCVHVHASPITHHTHLYCNYNKDTKNTA